MSRSLKLRLARALARMAGTRQIHIAGCARSGTTMAQFAMIAFDRVRIAEQETAVDYPGLRDTLRLYARGEIGRGPSVLVTKRGYRWHEPEQVERLIQRIEQEDLGLIYLVRDPRDVLSSYHSGGSTRTSYLTPARWLESVRAGERLLQAVGERKSTVVLRYEDFALDPSAVQRRLESAFGLETRAGVTSLAELEHNLALAQYRVAPNMELAMHRIRRIDASSVGRWRQSARAAHVLDDYPTIRAELEAFIEKYGFDSN